MTRFTIDSAAVPRVSDSCFACSPITFTGFSRSYHGLSGPSAFMSSSLSVVRSTTAVAAR